MTDSPRPPSPSRPLAVLASSTATSDPVDLSEERRLREVLRSFSEGFPARHDLSELDVDDLNPAQLRAVALAAIHQRDEARAREAIGRLNRTELAIGEKHCLRARALMAGDKFHDAISEARRVPAGTPDHPDAQLLIARAAAFLGDEEVFDRTLSKVPSTSLTPFKLLGLVTILVGTAQDPERTHRRWQTALGALQPSSGSPARQELDLVEFMEVHARAAVQYLRACREHGAYRRLTGRTEDDAWLALEAVHRRDGELSRLQWAVDVLPNQLELYLAELAGGRTGARPLLDFLLAPGLQDAEHLACLVESLVALEEYQFVVDSFPLTLFLPRAALSRPLSERLLLALHEAQAALQDPGLLDTRAALQALDVVADSSQVEGRHLLQRMTPDARACYESALLQLVALERSANPWRDGGLCAIGFLRVVERELSERWVKPSLHSVAREQLEREYAALTRADQHQFRRLYDAVRTLTPGRSASVDPPATMGLGTFAVWVQHMSGTRAKPPGRFGSLLFGDASVRLTSAGRTALADRSLEQVVPDSQRAEVRNRAAHGSFVPRESARRARDLADTALAAMDAWFAR